MSADCLKGANIIISINIRSSLINLPVRYGYDITFNNGFRFSF